MIKKLIRYDMLEGYRQHGWKLLVAVLLGVLFCIDFRMRMTNLFPELQTDMGDFIIYAIGGMKIYTPSPVEKFEFPVRWILYYSFLFYATLQYAENDMRGMGKQMIVRSGKRKYWWTAKLLWNISYVVAWMAVFYVTIAAYCLISGVSLNLSVHPGYGKYDLPEYGLIIILYHGRVLSGVCTGYLCSSSYKCFSDRHDFSNKAAVCISCN